MNFMSKDELVEFSDRSGLLNDLCFEREVLLAFNLAKESVIDELNNEYVLQLKFLEFLEAFARISNKSALPRFTNVNTRFLFVKHSF
jgi:hypothetical protein